MFLRAKLVSYSAVGSGQLCRAMTVSRVLDASSISQFRSYLGPSFLELIGLTVLGAGRSVILGSSWLI